MTATSKPKIAFLGLGTMGSGMARRLLQAGFPLTVYNRTRAKADALGAEGARVAATPFDAAQDAEIVISMVADDAAADALWLGGNGALAAAKSGTVLLECSTVSTAWIERLATAARARGCPVLDAPVTGSKAPAAAGELNFLVGGDAAALEKVRPALDAMGKSVQHLGPTGSGALMKLINNFLSGVQVAAFAEAMAIIERSGLDPAKAIAVLAGGAPGSPMVKTVAGRIAAHDYTPNFYLRLMAKDLRYAQQEAKRHAVELTTAATALAIFERAANAGHADQDMAAVVEPLRKQS